MANETTTTTANDLVYAASILQEDIIAALYPNRLAINMCRRASLVGFPSKAKDFPKNPVIAAAAVAEATDLSYTAYSTTKATLTTGEVGVVLTPTDVLNVSDIVDLGYYATEAGKAVADKENTDIAALSSGLSGSVGTTAVDLAEASILDAIATLEAASVPGPYAMLLHPQQKRDLVASVGTTISAAGTTGRSPRAETNEFGAQPDGMLGALYGMDVYVTAAVPTANAGADRLGMMVSVNRALGHVEKWAVRTELERDATLRATEIVVTSDYGVGEIDDASGVGILSDA